MDELRKRLVDAVPSPVLLGLKVIWLSVVILAILYLLDREPSDFIYWDQ